MARLRQTGESAQGILSADRPPPTCRLASLIAAILILAAAGLLQAVPTTAPVGGVILAACHVPLLMGSWFAALRWGGGNRGPGGRVFVLFLAAQLYFSAVIGSTMIIGIGSFLTRPMMLTVLAAAGLALMWTGRRSAGGPVIVLPRTGLARWMRIATGAVVTSVMVPGLLAPEYVYDALTYHLAFPAQWIQEGRISIVPTWFGDPAPSYAPAAADVYFTSLMLPLGEDWAARVGQFPFYLLLLLGAEGLAREMRLGRTTRAGVVLIIAGLPGIAGQAMTAMVDVALAAHLVCAVGFALRVGRGGRAIDACGLVLSIGLAAGTKFLALMYLMAFTPLFLWAALALVRSRKRSPKLVLASFAIAAWIGGYWYVRNWTTTGNPVYPLRVSLDQTTIFNGPFGREQMSANIMNDRLAGDSMALARVLWQGMSLWGREDIDVSVGLSSRMVSKWLAAAVIATLALAFIASGILAAFRPPRRAGMMLLYPSIGLAIGLFWLAVPVQDFRYAWGPLVLVLVTSFAAIRGGRIMRWLTIAGGSLLLMVELNAVVARTSLCRDWRRDARERAFDGLRWAGIGQAWRFADYELRGKTIAYSGNNVPYFLYGRQLENHVTYVPARAEPFDRFDQWAAVAKAFGEPRTAEPTFDRWTMDPAAWIAGLQREKVDYFVVNSLALFPNLLMNVRHDAEGFPIERQWLDSLVAEGAAQRVRFPDERVAVYRLLLDRLRDLPRGMQAIRQDETDAIDRWLKDRPPTGMPIAEYPLARPYLEKHHLLPAAP